jgi:hypothetical protein
MFHSEHHYNIKVILCYLIVVLLCHTSWHIDTSTSLSFLIGKSRALALQTRLLRLTFLFLCSVVTGSYAACRPGRLVT